MGVRCTTMVVGKVGLVMILLTLQVSVSVGFRVLLGMLERKRSTRVLSTGTKQCSLGHRTLIPRVERSADTQFRHFRLRPWLAGFIGIRMLDERARRTMSFATDSGVTWCLWRLDEHLVLNRFPIFVGDRHYQ